MAEAKEIDRNIAWEQIRYQSWIISAVMGGNKGRPESLFTLPQDSIMKKYNIVDEAIAAKKMVDSLNDNNILKIA